MVENGRFITAVSNRNRNKTKIVKSIQILKKVLKTTEKIFLFTG